MIFKLLPVVLITLFIGLLHGQPLPLITISPDHHSFLESSTNHVFVPFGTNYFDPQTGWAPKIWSQFNPDRVEHHFALMQGIGVNTARVFLAATIFQPNAQTISEDALKKLDALISIARRHQIRLILTGPDAWEGSPDYWQPSRYCSAQALEVLNLFWTTVGRRYRNDGTILAWELLNEPHLPWSDPEMQKRWNKPIPDDKLDSNQPALVEYQHFREQLADQWMQTQVDALRAADPTHLITIGYIQWSYPLILSANKPSGYSAFNPQRQAKFLDFLTMHFYPLLGEPLANDQTTRRNLRYLQAALASCNNLGKPVILGEFGWYGGGPSQSHPPLTQQQQADFLEKEIQSTRPLCAGWLSWAFADTPTSTDITLRSGLFDPDLHPKSWADTFSHLAKSKDSLPLPPPSLTPLDIDRALRSDLQQLKQLHEDYCDSIAKSSTH